MANGNKEYRKSKLISTYFRNGIKSNLDLTTLADTKAGILISVNGFILTVIMTASGFVIQNSMMNIAFASIILTALVSIVFAVFAIRPRSKDNLVKKDDDIEHYSSLLFYGDMAELHPDDFMNKTDLIIKCPKLSAKHLTRHLHILSLDIKKKYFWLKQAYTFFSIGLIVSVSLAVYGLIFIEQTPFNKISTGNISYKKGTFENIFEPSGLVQFPDGNILIIEDESKAKLSIVQSDRNGYLNEIGKLNMSKEIKKMFKHKIDDLEALTNNQNIVYAITSHSLTKNNQKLLSRNKFIRFEYKNGTLQNFKDYTNLKEEIYKNFPDLFTTSSFNLNTFNIEGLSYDTSRNRLLIGLRGPLIKQQAIIIEIKNPDEIFLNNKKPEFADAIFLNLNNLGIRDFTYDEEKKGFWIIAGSSNNRNGQSFELWFLNQDRKTLNKIKNIPNIGFAEGISLIKNNNKVNLLIVEDNGIRPNKAASYITIEKDSL